jgi:glycosyltransferase involved in cell wall biosynthesis
VLEALCSGVPVVTTRFNGAAEVIQPGRTGFVINRPDDIRGLARAIDAALAPHIRAACASQAEAMRERLSMRRHVAELMQLYGELTSRRRPSAM